MQQLQLIQQRIFEIRGQKVIEELKDRVGGHDAQLKPHPSADGGHLRLKEKENIRSSIKVAA